MKKNILLTIIVVVVCILLCEGLFRFYEHRTLSLTMRPTGDVVDLLALNYNDTSVPKKKPAGEFRVLEFGDSYCYSIVKYPASYHGVAGDLLVKSGTVEKARLVNFGEPASSFYQYLKSVANWTDQLEYDAVVVNIYLGNDILEIAHNLVPDDTPINRLFLNDFSEIPTGRKRLAAVPHTFGLRMFDYAYAYLMMAVEGYFTKKDIPEPYIPTVRPLKENAFYFVSQLAALAGEPTQCEDMARGWKGLADLARGLSKLARERGVKVAIMISPTEVAVNERFWKETAARQKLDPDSFDPNLASRMAKAIIAQTAPEVPVLDLTPVFRCAIEQGATEYYPSETHWNAAGNKLAGEALGRFIATTWFGVAPEKLGELPTCLTAKEPDAASDVGACLKAAGFSAP